METQSSIYAKTYNFVYLRAKSILEKEDDIQQLMKEVYVQALEQEIKEEKLYSWLGRQVYILGCGKFRKKKAREADYIELDKQQYAASKTVDMEQTIEVICETLDELPDMYRATLYAFYYDHMKVKEIAAATGYSAGVIINRINYTHKYLEKALELYAEEQKAKVQFSVEAVVLALTNWTENHCLSQQVAQNIYGSICRELGVQTEVIETEDKGGCEHRVREYDGDIVTELSEEFAAYQPKNKKEIEPRFLAIGAVAVLAVLILVAVFALVKPGDKKNKPKNPNTTEQQDTSDEILIENETEEETAKDDSYVLPNSDKVLLTRADLQGLTKEQLYYARNEIFARHGMIFGPDDLEAYFESKSWYKGTIPYDDFYNQVEMSLTEEANVALILEVEEEMQ